MIKVRHCSICGTAFAGWGNNPAPVKKRGRCCDYCNWHAVIPARLQAIYSKKQAAAKGKER